jgi:hypothetical protein
MIDAGPIQDMISLTAHDRCDRCGSQAYAVAERYDLPTALMFCRHHGTKHEDVLLFSGFTVTWDTEKVDADLFPANRQQGEDY